MNNNSNKNHTYMNTSCSTYNLNDYKLPYVKSKKCIYKTPSMKYVVSDNKVQYNNVTNHTWSNQSGYGNIAIQSSKGKKVYTYNRLKPLYAPYYTNVDVNMAWSKK